MARRGTSNFAREAQQPTIQDAVFKECMYKEWYTHDKNPQCNVQSWGDDPVDPQHKISAYSRQYAPPKLYSQKDREAPPAGKPSEIIQMYGGKELPEVGQDPRAAAGKSSMPK